MSKKPLSMRERALMVGQGVTIGDFSGITKTAVGATLQRGMQTTELKEQISELEQKLAKAGQGGTRMFPLDQLHKVEGRQRTLSDEERSDLLENLRHNPLDTPITVTKREEGGWYIVSGNNRVDMYRELDRTEIEGIEKDYADDVADKQAFFSNLLHPSLTDFEKFQGFKMLMEKYSMTQDEVGKSAGINKGTVSRLMSYDKLPQDVKDILSAHPSKLGASAALEFAALTEAGKGDQVTEAVKNIVFRDITQATALAVAKKVETPEKITPAVQKYTIKQGKKKFAEMRGTQNTIRIDFADEEKRMKLEILIHDLIQTYSEE